MAVILVAISRSSVSGSVVYRSRGKPVKPSGVVFITMRSSTPASILVLPRVAVTVAIRVPSPPRTNASGRAGRRLRSCRQWWPRMLTLARSTWRNSRKCSASASPYASIAPSRWSCANA